VDKFAKENPLPNRFRQGKFRARAGSLPTGGRAAAQAVAAAGAALVDFAFAATRLRFK